MSGSIAVGEFERRALTKVKRYTLAYLTLPFYSHTVAGSGSNGMDGVN